MVARTNTHEEPAMYDYNGPTWSPGYVEVDFPYNGKVEASGIAYSIDGYPDVEVACTDERCLKGVNPYAKYYAVIVSLTKKGTNIKIYKLFGSRW